MPKGSSCCLAGSTENLVQDQIFWKPKFLNEIKSIYKAIFGTSVSPLCT